VEAIKIKVHPSNISREGWYTLRRLWALLIHSLEEWTKVLSKDT
jgi:hypothetical protein